LEEAGDIIQAVNPNAISADLLREISSLAPDPGVKAEGGVTVFKSVGIAAQDWAVKASLGAVSAASGRAVD
jgi:ornithine cyclodeaminase